MPSPTSPFAALFIALQAHIKANVPAIRYIDQDHGQLDHYDTRPAVSWPCSLIDIDAMRFEDMGELAQLCIGEIVIRLGFAPYSASNNLTARKTRHLALEYYNLEWALNKALHGWSPDMKDTGDYDPDEYSEEDYLVTEKTDYEFGVLTRVSAQTERSDHPFRVREIRYRIEFEDYSAARKIKKGPASPRFTIS